MNVIVGNRQQAILNELNIDIIKSVTGQYDVDTFIEMFKNFYYQRMILDITAIKNYYDAKVLQKLSIGLDMEKVILLLDNTDESSSAPDYLSKLISIGIYNFTKNAEGIMYLYNNPNTYRDVAQYHQLDNVIVEQVMVTEETKACRIIGIKDLTDNSGATTLTYLMYRQLKKKYDVLAVEVDKNDFTYFNNGNLISIVSNELGKVIANNSNKDAIIIDVNNSPMAIGMVQDIIYLVEPSIIKLNKLMIIKRNAFKELKDRKIILNQSVLSKKDILELEYEARAKFFFNMPPLNEREDNIPILNTFLYKLGFIRQESGFEDKKKRGLL
ncbi:MAG: hypothetical protein RSB71_00310 [Bacilli bacterium]